RRRRFLLHEHGNLRADAPEARHAGRRRRVPDTKSANQSRVLRQQTGRNRTAANGRTDGRRNGTGTQKRNGQQRDKTSKAGNRTGSPGAAVHQRRRKDSSRYSRRRVSLKSVAGGSSF